MKKFLVNYTEFMNYTILVTANSKKEAKERIKNGLEDFSEPVKLIITNTKIKSIDEIKG